MDTQQGGAPAAAAPAGKFKIKVKAPAAAPSSGAPPPVASKKEEDLLEDNVDAPLGFVDHPPVSKKPARRAAVLADDDDDEDGPGQASEQPMLMSVDPLASSAAPPSPAPSTLSHEQPAPAAKKPRLVSTAQQQQQLLKQQSGGGSRPSSSVAGSYTPTPAPSGSRDPTPPPAEAVKASSKGAKGEQAGQRRSGRARKLTEKAFGAEETPYDPDDLEALADDDDAMEYMVEEDEDDMDMDVGSRKGKRQAGGSAGGAGKAAGGKGKRGNANFALAPLPDTDLGGDIVPVAFGQTDFSTLKLKPDHAVRPLWATPDGHIFLETFSHVYRQAQDFLIAIAEPVCRPEYVHEYQLTPHSLYAAVSVGLDTETIVSVLNRLSKVHLDDGLKQFIVAATKNYGKVKLVLKRNHFYVETSDPVVFDKLWKDPVISSARANDEVLVEQALRERAVASITRVADADLAAGATNTIVGTSKPRPANTAAASADASRRPGSFVAPSAASQAPQKKELAMGGKAGGPLPPAALAATRGVVDAPGFYASGGDTGVGCYVPEEEMYGGPDFEAREGGQLSIDEVEEGVEEGKVVKSFEVKSEQVELVKRRCLPGPGGLNYPMLEEYDFRGDRSTPDLNVELKPMAKLRPYQEKSLSKMFGNGRARSGIIVLPCGAGKSLVGVAAAARMRKSCLCLCTSSVSVDQWKHQFMLWTNLQDHQISRFTSENKEQFSGDAGITVTTFTMVAFSGKRSDESEKVMEQIRSREWGLLLMDEVHVVPAQMFRKVISIIHSHCKLGLTATLVREDERIGDLNFLIGPKLYEANWLDLTRAGHIANVQCVEVWCPMTREFYREYLKPENSSRKQLLYCMNPNKFMACQFLINWHERERKDKVIVFSDNIWALREYAQRMGKPFIYGPTHHSERTRVLHAFKNDPNVNTVFLSKVGDNSLDIPEANVLIQISSHAGSRRQEAQRLGRILRAKRAKSGPVSSTEYNAFFYSLVSQDTQEMFYSTKRRQFLIDQGYAFKVVTNLVDTALEATEGQLYFSKKEQQLDLLCRVLTAGLEEAGVEVGARDNDEEELAQEFATTKGGVRRKAADVRSLTGAAGLRYAEYRAEAGPAAQYALPAPGGAGRGGGGAGRGGKPKKSEQAKAWEKKLLNVGKK